MQIPQLVNVLNGHGSFNNASTLSAIATTLTPPSYAGWPTSGQFPLIFSDNGEIVLVTDASVHPWPIARAQETSNGGGAAASHAIGVAVVAFLSAATLQHLIAVEQNGTLVAIAQVLNFVGGATITNPSDGVAQIAAGGTVAPIEFVIDGGGSVITTGSKGYLEVPFGCTITAVRLMADQTGSISVTIKKANYATMPTTTSIVAAAPPTLSTARKSQDTTLTGWTTAITAGDWLEYVVDSAATVTRVTVSLTVSRT